jgi:hypothetical protein
MQIDVIEAQLIQHKDGVHVSGQEGVAFVLKGKYAEKVWAQYEQQLKAGAGQFDLRIRINVDVAEPIGVIVHPSHPDF